MCVLIGLFRSALPFLPSREHMSRTFYFSQPTSISLSRVSTHKDSCFCGSNNHQVAKHNAVPLRVFNALPPKWKKNDTHSRVRKNVDSIATPLHVCQSKAINKREPPWNAAQLHSFRIFGVNSDFLLPHSPRFVRHSPKLVRFHKQRRNQPKSTLQKGRKVV